MSGGGMRLLARAQADQAFHTAGVDELVLASVGGNVLCETARSAYGYMLAVDGGCDGANTS
jgi:hypothetical protein